MIFSTYLQLKVSVVVVVAVIFVAVFVVIVAVVSGLYDLSSCFLTVACGFRSRP